MSKVKSTGFMKCFLVALITASLTLAYFIIKGKGIFTVADDFNVQQLTFAAAVWSAIRSEDPGQWVWNLDLGSSLITGFSFYNLGSPFLWISLLFPKGSYPYLAGYLQIIKYVVATMSAYVYIRCVVGNESSDSDRYAIAGALLYAFSGYQTTSLMFHFHDAVAFFPLLLWGIENVDDRRKRPQFILAVFVNCLVNYFCFIQEVIFMILYFVIRYWGAREEILFAGCWHVCGVDY